MSQPEPVGARSAIEATFHVASLLRKAVDEKREFQWEYAGGETADGQGEDSFRIVIDVKPKPKQ